MAKHRRKGSSKAGRPRKGGDRYACGKLKPEAPNQQLMAVRASMLGVQVGKDGRALGYQNASNPLDLALARGWLTEPRHKAGVAYAAAYARSKMGAPGLDAGGLAQGDPSASLGRDVRDSFSTMTDEEISAIFDRVFNRAANEGGDDRQAQAFLRWKMLNQVLTPAERNEAQMTCIYGDWPQWIMQRVAGRFSTSWEARFDLLVVALDKIAKALRPARKPAPDIPDAPAPSPEPREPKATTAKAAPGGKRIDRTAYVNPDGEVLYEVERKVRRA